MKRKRKILGTPEERARSEEIRRELEAHIERITAEFRARGHEPITDLQYWLDRGRAELAAKRRPEPA